MIRALDKRLRALEQTMALRMGECRCRVGQKTKYHNAAELELIVQIECPAHQVCDLGDLQWVGQALPLRTEDQQFCSCPPTPIRQLLLGSRGPLTQAEHEFEMERWAREYGAGSDEEFRRDQEPVNELLRIYQYRKFIKERAYG